MNEFYVQSTATCEPILFHAEIGRPLIGDIVSRGDVAVQTAPPLPVAFLVHVGVVVLYG